MRPVTVTGSPFHLQLGHDLALDPLGHGAPPLPRTLGLPEGEAAESAPRLLQLHSDRDSRFRPEELFAAVRERRLDRCRDLSHAPADEARHHLRVAEDSVNEAAEGRGRQLPRFDFLTRETVDVPQPETVRARQVVAEGRDPEAPQRPATLGIRRQQSGAHGLRDVLRRRGGSVEAQRRPRTILGATGKQQTARSQRLAVVAATRRDQDQPPRPRQQLEEIEVSRQTRRFIDHTQASPHRPGEKCVDGRRLRKRSLVHLPRRRSARHRRAPARANPPASTSPASSPRTRAPATASSRSRTASARSSSSIESPPPTASTSSRLAANASSPSQVSFHAGLSPSSSPLRSP